MVDPIASNKKANLEVSFGHTRKLLMLMDPRTGRLSLLGVLGS